MQECQPNVTGSKVAHTNVLAVQPDSITANQTVYILIFVHGTGITQHMSVP